MPRTCCPTCGSAELRAVVMPSGPHYAKRVCPDGHFVDWLPHPRTHMGEMPAELAPLVVARTRPVTLRGTPGQVSAALTVRYRMVSANHTVGRDDFVRMLGCVNGATWFLANKGLAPPDLKCWPRPDQMEPVGP